MLVELTKGAAFLDVFCTCMFKLLLHSSAHLRQRFDFWTEGSFSNLVIAMIRNCHL